MAKWAPTRAKFYALSGIPAAACVASARVVGSVDPTTDTVVVSGHGFETGTRVRFEVASEDGELPAPLSGALLYQAVEVSGTDLFKVAELDGALVDLTTSGTGPLRILEDFGAKLDAILYARARWCDDHAIPYTPPAVVADGWPPDSLELCAVKLAALDVADVLRSASPAYSKEDLVRAANSAQTFLDKLRDGRPLAVAPVDATPAVAELGGKAVTRSRPSKGWKVSAV